MIPYIHKAIFKVNNFLESSPSFWIMRSQRDPDVAIKAYDMTPQFPGHALTGLDWSALWLLFCVYP